MIWETMINTLNIKPNLTIRLSVLLLLSVMAVVSSMTLFAQEAAQVQVTAARANVRSGPGTSYAVIGKANRGDTFAILGTNNAKNWYQIAFAGEQNGWIAGSIVTTSGPVESLPMIEVAAPATPTATATATVTEVIGNGITLRVNRDRVNLRNGPNTTAAIVGKAQNGEQFKVTGRNGAGDWYAIELADGSGAWIYETLVTIQGDIATLSNVAPPTTTATIQPTTTVPSDEVNSADPTATPSVAEQVAETALSTLPRGIASGRLLYSVANDDAQRWELWEYEFGAQHSTKIADWRTELDISNDGRQIAYFAWPGDAGEKVGIWIMDADFTNNRLLVPGGAYPSFNPGGDRLVVNGPDRTLYLINSDGSGLRALAKGEYPAWSPTDNRIVHRNCNGGSCGLWIIDANSTDPNATQRITTGGGDGQPAWSPDGKRIAYISKEDGNFEIYVVNSDGTNPVRVTSDPASDGLPIWSPDGRWLAFRSDRGGSWAIYIVRPDGSELHQVIDADVLDYWLFEKMIWR